MSLPARFQRKKHPRALPAAPRRCEPTHVQLKPRLVCFVDAQSIWAQMTRDRDIEREIRTLKMFLRVPYPEPLFRDTNSFFMPDGVIRYGRETTGAQTIYYIPLTVLRN